MVFNTIGQIADNIARSFVLPEGVSGALLQSVDMARIEVQNFIDTSIDGDSIPEKYQSAIVNFAKAQAIEDSFTWSSTVATSGGSVIVGSGTSSTSKRTLGDMEVTSDGKAETAALNFLTGLSKDTPERLRAAGEKSLDNLSRTINFYKANG